jgi:hypothetical protein
MWAIETPRGGAEGKGGNWWGCGREGGGWVGRVGQGCGKKGWRKEGAEKGKEEPNARDDWCLPISAASRI